MEIQDLVLSEQTSNESMDSYLGNDLLTEILVRLPIKPLFRLKCVSKLWNRLISSDQLQRKIRLSPGLFYRFLVSDCEPELYRYVSLSDENSDEGAIEDISLSFLPHYPYTEIIDSCNGLLLLLWLETDGVACQMEYYVCNPLTKRWVAFPGPRERVGFDSARLAFDPTVSHDFQVIHICCPSDQTVTSVAAEIFSSATGQWVESSYPCEPVPPFFLPHISVFFNGIFYFMNLPQYIMGFNVSGGKCCVIRFPEERRHQAFLKICKGCIYFVNHDNFVINVWSIEDTSTYEWTLKRTTNLQASLPLCDLYRSNLLHHTFYPFDFHPEREAVFLKFLRKVFSYDFMSSTLKELCCSEVCLGPDSDTLPFEESVTTYRPHPNALDWAPSSLQEYPMTQ